MSDKFKVQATIWVEFDKPKASDGETLDEAGERLAAVYSRLFHKRLGFTDISERAVWWHSAKQTYCITVDEAGGFRECVPNEPGIRLNVTDWLINS